jgi:hypothetical protein
VLLVHSPHWQTLSDIIFSACRGCAANRSTRYFPTCFAIASTSRSTSTSRSRAATKLARSGLPRR